MPYIKQEDRKRVTPIYVEGRYPTTPGELNYIITELVWEYYHKGANYQAINDILGALEGAKLEFYRRVAAPYEDGKIEENGDVYV